MPPQPDIQPAPVPAWVRPATRLLDDRFRIPGTRLRFGLDFLLGLVPGAGDVASFAISGLLVISMATHGASGMLVVKMIFNLLVDAIIGSIPLIGNIFDFSFKANRRNLRLLEEYHAKGRHRGSAWWVLWVLLFVFLALIVGMIYLFVLLYRLIVP